MGLFDKLRRAFSAQPEEELKVKQEDEKQAELQEKEVEENETPVVDEASEKVELDSTEPSQVVEDETIDQSVNEIADAENNLQADNQEIEIQNVNELNSQANVDEAKRYDKGLEKSRQGFGAKINALLANFRSVDEDFFEELEETLIEADVGFETAMNISEQLRAEVKLRNAKSKADVSDAIIEKLVDMYEEEGQNEDNSLHFAKQGPTVILFVGVNGVGKTTTIGKLAHRYNMQGKKVLLAACDTFRAGAIQQLAKWGERVSVEVVQKPEKSDPAAVAFDAIKKAKAENYDILLVDTAGRLQNKVNLMNELAKIKRILQKEIPDAPHEVLLALDATTGQNALTQAKQFKEVTDVTGIVLTKLDGTARGGIVLAIRNELHLPVKLVGLGEGMDDLRDFNAEDFVYGLFKGLVTPKKD
ncbi:signal recognition particle-docking protein FtsY [Ligilactobacillus sp. Marseille-Q7487]|uniref:signal recognition particle-docking protein FtsY n=1 Tax=Ligilactobacillus sp. Marseille-Q7487 TaxID=3022128 RepID=UPI0024A99F5A|nr:signal recognition particle-docking protein FtsY [Ligilactobacillus sp. Marseille-Q7487]